MEEELLIGLPEDISAVATITYEFPQNRKYLIQNTPPELTRWAAGSMTSQNVKGENFFASLFILDVKKAFTADLWARKPNVIFFYTIKGYFSYRNSANTLQILQGESAVFQAQPEHFKMQVLPGRHVYFFFYLKPKLLKKLASEFESLRPLLAPVPKNELIIHQAKNDSQLAKRTLFRLRRTYNIGKISENKMEGIILELASSIQSAGQIDLKEKRLTTKEIVSGIRGFIGNEIGRGAVPSVKEVAEIFSLTPRRLGEVFHDLFGLPLRDYLNAKRMDESYRLLTEEKMKVSDVAEYLGYQDPANFSRRFKNYFGFPPSEAADAKRKNI